MCEIYGYCGNKTVKLNSYTDEFWKDAKIHKDGFGYYLADKDELFVNADSALQHLESLYKKNFNSSLALFHIRFKTHGDSKIENCHPFINYDSYGTKWALIHNGYTDDNNIMKALTSYQHGDTDSERLLLYIIEKINQFYDHSFIEDEYDLFQGLYKTIQNACDELSKLGKTNLIFTDNYTNNMYVYINHSYTLFYYESNDGIHFSTRALSTNTWKAVPANKLLIINRGKFLNFNS